MRKDQYKRIDMTDTHLFFSLLILENLIVFVIGYLTGRFSK